MNFSRYYREAFDPNIMKILVIPDVHLKPQMFKQATALMHQGIADRAVCLMDIPDDWDK